MAASLPGTALEAERPVPAVRFGDAASGETVDLWYFRQRRALALCFLHDDCARCASFAEQLAALADDLRFADAEARVVLARPASLALPVLVERDGASARLLGQDARLPIIVLLDRYGAALASFPAPRHDFPDPDEVAATLLHDRLQCPECGAPTW